MAEAARRPLPQRRAVLLFAPRRYDARTLEHRPLVRTGADDREAFLLGALPGTAESVTGQFPGALALLSAAGRLAFHLAVRGKRHLEFDIGRRRRRERLTVEERGLDLIRRKFRCGSGHAGCREEEAHGADRYSA